MNINYEYNKYITDKNNLKNTLNEYGVAIIPNLLNVLECEEINNGIWDYFEHISQNWKDKFSPIKRNDVKSWRNIYDLYPIHNHLFKHYSVGHSQICWDIRQNNKVLDIFTNFWDCKQEDLFVSFDGLSFCLPPELTNKGWENKTGFHTDQRYLRNDFECIQSWVTANDIEEGDGTLAIMEGSHKYHKDFGEFYKINNKSDWYKLNSIEEKFYADKKCEYKKIKCPRGSLVLWDSRTIHYGANPIKKRKNKSFRSIIYLCYGLKNNASIKQIVKKQELFYKKQTSNHWPCNPKPNPDLPHTYGKELPIVTKIKDPILNDIGMSLAGF